MKIIDITRWTAALALSAMTALPASAGEVIVSREGKSVAIYFRMALTDVPELFGHNVPGLVDKSGLVTLDEIYEGTFDDADLLARDVSFSLGGKAVHFDALSMMVHEDDTWVPFDTPLAADMAIAVCGVPLPEGPLDAENFVWMGGWYAYPVAADEDLTIQFPQTGRNETEISVRVFERGSLARSTEVTLADGQPLHLPKEPSGWFSWLF